MTSFGEKMRYVRNSKGWTQEVLADILGSTKQVISHYENGQRVPKVDVAAAIADALGVSVCFLSDQAIPASAYTKEEYVIEKDNVPDARLSGLISMYSKMDAATQVILLEEADRLLSSPRNASLDDSYALLYSQLDESDRIRIKERMAIMLEADKYSAQDASKNA